MTNNTPVAIIGMSCIFPGAPGLKQYWRLLFHGKDAITEVPNTHWRAEDYFDPDPKKPDHVYCTRGGFISPVPFDPTEFGIPPSSLEATDTSQLLGLVAAKTALADAGYGEGKNFQRDKTAVILGLTGTQELVIPLAARLGYPKWRKALEESGISGEKADEAIARIADSYVSWQENSFPGLLGNVVAGRICNRLDLGGTNCAVDAACASSISAINLAILELLSGASDMVITGGVDLLNDIFMHMCFSKTFILSPTGDARPFSKDADGTVLGEGIGMVVLKKLSDAEKDGDRIYALIRSIGTSSDGKSQSIYAPRPEGQAKALKAAYEIAQISPDTVELIEAHGTGTRVGDRVEIQALKQVFGNSQSTISEFRRCAIGSVKSMIGHTKAAAGAAGLIKAALSLYHKVLAPTLKADTPDPGLDIANSPLYINTQLQPWLSKKEHPRRAGVSAFGFGGSNFHVIMEEYKKNKSEISWDGSVEILAFSNTEQNILINQVRKFKEDVDRGLTDDEFSYRAAQTRNAFSYDHPHRLLIVADRESGQWAVVSNQKDSGQKIVNRKSKIVNHSTDNCADKPGKFAFMFPGQGSQYVGMGRDLVCIFPQALEVLEQANEAYKNNNEKNSSLRLSDFIYPVPATTDAEKKIQEEALQNTAIAQPAIGAVSAAILKVLEYFGVKPDAVCGHSFGEITALFAANRIDINTFFHLAVSRGKFMAQTSGKNSGAMLAVKAPLDEIEKIAKSALVVLANRNSPDQGVLSGSVQAIDNAETLCKQSGFPTKRLPVSAAFHSELVKDAGKPFAQILDMIDITGSKIPVFSNTTADTYPDDAQNAKALLAGHILNPVNFVGQILNMFKSGVRTFVEIGPRSVLTGLVKSILTGMNFNVFSADASSGKHFGLKDLALILCQLASLGYNVDLKRWEHPVSEKKKQRMSILLSGANYRKESVSKKNLVASSHLVPPAPPSKNRGDAAVKGSQNSTLKTKNFKKQGGNNTPVIKNYEVKEMNTKNTINQNHVVTDALKVVQEGLKSMQTLQMQTAQTHQKFLETQAEASRTLRDMMQNIRQLAEKFDGKNVKYEAKSENIEAISYAAQKESGQLPVVSCQKESGQLSVTPLIPPFGGRGGQKSTDHCSLITDHLLSVVSELTGYPVEMISPDMDIETDLGIDSIKRVEILSNMEEKIPNLPAVSPEIMGTLRTLKQIAEYLSGHQTKESGQLSVVSYQKSTDHCSLTTDQLSTDHCSLITDHLLSVVSELTGYPVEMLSPDMDIETDLGIDSIKRVEILSMMEEKTPNLPAVSPEIMGTLRTLRQIAEYLSGHQTKESGQLSVTPLIPPFGGRGGQKSTDHCSLITDHLLSVVSELTGYPVEMLSPDMDIESDLGIDSIKRVEILSMMEEKLPDLPPVSPEVMGDLKTLKQIIEYLSGNSGQKDSGQLSVVSGQKESGQLSVVSGQKPTELASYTSNTSPTTERSIISVVEAPSISAKQISIPHERKIIITDDGNGFAKAIAEKFKSINVDAAVIDLSNIYKKGDLIGGLVILAPASVSSPEHAISFLKSAFEAAHQLGPKLIDSAEKGGAIFATITRLDGAFGNSPRSPSFFQREGQAEFGGLAGLAKTAALEWDKVSCHAIDIKPDWNKNDEIATAVVNEILHTGPVEIGLMPAGKRITLALEASPYPQGQIRLDAGDVIVVSGGARGVTAAAMCELANHVRPTFILLGRSPLPAVEPSWCLSLNQESDIKRAILENEFNGKTVLPVQIEKAYHKHMASREIIANLNYMKNAGAKVLYYPVDIRDKDSINKIFTDVRMQHGSIKAFIHGAGILKDRLIIDKTPEEFSSVFDTKVVGLLNLLEATKSDPLKYIVLFSSVSARMGNKGQADYAMANEVLNKIAVQESICRKDCRVISINWGPWDGGMVSPALKREFTRKGISLIPIQDGARCLVQEMSGDTTYPVEVVIGAGLKNDDEKKMTSPPPPPKGGIEGDYFHSSELSLTFRREIDIDRFPVLKSHVVGGKPVVPFALITEWLGHGALHGNPGLFLSGLDDIRLFNRIKLDSEKKLIRLLAGKARKNGMIFEVDVEIRDGVKENIEPVYSSAKAILSEEPPPAPEFKSGDYPKTGKYTRNIDEIYENILFHGIELRGIREIVGYSSSGMIAKIAPAPPPEKWMEEPLRSRWIADPLVLESAFQMAMIWCFEEIGAAFLPVYAASYRQYLRSFPSDGVTAVMEITETTHSNMKSDFTFLDKDSRVVARLIGAVVSG